MLLREGFSVYNMRIALVQICTICMMGFDTVLAKPTPAPLTGWEVVWFTWLAHTTWQLLDLIPKREKKEEPKGVAIQIERPPGVTRVPVPISVPKDTS